jgi:hypothetical protein
VEKAKTFKRIGNIVGLEAKKKTQRGILGKMFGKWYDKHIDHEVRSMRQITFRNIKVNDPMSGKTYYL